ncbi:MAG TPA: allantoicase [Kofleriaceae bacterium]|jgi:allantoicase
MSSSTPNTGPAWLDLPDLASANYGGATLLANDEFFAEKENLLKPEAAVWKEGVYGDRGKWMDGWETRRYRPVDGVAPGPESNIHDWCIVRLGLPGVIRGVVVDTAWFRGNYPASASIWATEVDAALDIKALENAQWTEILPRTNLQGDHKNTFETKTEKRFTHLRLQIYPDGGVARLRVHGEATPVWSQLRALGGPVDLAALENGAVVETCSDMFFGSRNNLIKPGPSLSMADGWETRRRRGPGNDWAIIRLAAAGTIDRLLVDTSHFKGNAPALCTVDGVHAPGVAAERLEGWRPLLASPLQPHTRHQFGDELRRIGPVTHLRLSVYPCGGIARLRAWGTLISVAQPGLDKLNALAQVDARAAFKRCCGSTRFADTMTALRPFTDEPALLVAAERTWWSLDEAAHKEAFSAHPKIGDKKAPAAGDQAWSSGEQAAAASANAQILAELTEAQRAYDAKFGFIYIVCATGKPAGEMLADCTTRLTHTAATELRCAAEEQMKITRLRLVKLLAELA